MRALPNPPRTALMNPSRFWPSQLGALYLAGDQSRAGHYAGASVWCLWAVIAFLYVCLPDSWFLNSTGKFHCSLSFFYLFTIRKFSLQNLKDLYGYPLFIYILYKIKYNTILFHILMWHKYKLKFETNSVIVLIDFLSGFKANVTFYPSFQSFPPDYSPGFICSFSLLMHCPGWLEAIGFRLESLSVPSLSRKKRGGHMNYTTAKNASSWMSTPRIRSSSLALLLRLLQKNESRPKSQGHRNSSGSPNSTDTFHQIPIAHEADQTKRQSSCDASPLQHFFCFVLFSLWAGSRSREEEGRAKTISLCSHKL